MDAPPVPLSAERLRECLEDVYQSCLPLREGEVADYIPELKKADPELFGLAVCTTGTAKKRCKAG